MRKSKFLKNVVVGFGGEAIIMVLGFIIPRIMITSYGSDTNGLVSTITQIFTYAALLEAGISQAAKNALFKPIAEGNKEQISYVASVAKRYYQRITVYYGAIVVAISFAAPFIIRTEIPNTSVFLMVFLEGMSGVISFYYIQTTTTILNADGRSYITNSVAVANKIISYSVKITMAMLGANIVILQLSYFIITVCKTFFYQIYFKKKYDWVKFNSAPKTAKLKDRNAYVITELAWTIFSSTDMIVLSTFVSTQMASVYGVYNLVVNSINVLINAVYNSIVYMLGQSYHKSIKEYIKMHDTFNSVFLGGTTILMCITYILFIPFIRLYTTGVEDVNYIYENLPVLFCLVQIFSKSRYVSGNLTGIAGYAKYASVASIIEALLNVSLSIIFVRKMGISGVLLATVLALPLKIIVCTYLADIKILKRSAWKSIRILSVNYLLFFAAVMANKFINFNIVSYKDFIIYGILLSAVFGIAGIGLNLLANTDCLSLIKTFKLKKSKN